MPNRLPSLPRARDCGYVYVVKLGGIYKIGFSRRSVWRRVQDCGGQLVLTVPTGQQPGSFERAIHQHFAHKRTDGPGFVREWFALDAADLDWLRDLPRFMCETVKQTASDNCC